MVSEVVQYEELDPPNLPPSLIRRNALRSVDFAGGRV